MRVRITTTFTEVREIDETEEHFLEPSEDEEGQESENFEPFDEEFALKVLDADFDDDPIGQIETYDDWAVTFEVLPDDR